VHFYEYYYENYYTYIPKYIPVYILLSTSICRMMKIKGENCYADGRFAKELFLWFIMWYSELSNVVG
jgi:hypothetical protein